MAAQMEANLRSSAPKEEEGKMDMQTKEKSPVFLLLLAVACTTR